MRGLAADDRSYALDGAARAIQRAVSTSDPRRIAHAAAEAAFWLAAVDEAYGGNDQSNPYIDACVEAGSRNLMVGLRFARNAAVHSELARLAEPTGGVRFPLSFPLAFVRVACWIRQDVPELPRGSIGQRKAFLKALAGREVESTLQQAVGWLRDWDRSR